MVARRVRSEQRAINETSETTLPQGRASAELTKHTPNFSFLLGPNNLPFFVPHLSSPTKWPILIFSTALSVLTSAQPTRMSPPLSPRTHVTSSTVVWECGKMTVSRLSPMIVRSLSESFSWKFFSLTHNQRVIALHHPMLRFLQKSVSSETPRKIKLR